VISWATRRPAVIWALAAGVVISGGVAFTKLPLATRSTIEYPKLSITARWTGASPELVEMYLTAPIEGVVQGVRGVRKTSSISTLGSCSVTVDLDPKADITLTRLAILERMQTLKAGFPIAASAPRVQNYTPENQTEKQLMEINVTGPITPGALLQIINQTLTPRLSAIDGVSSVKANGGAAIGITISYDPTLLHQLALSPNALSAALASARQTRALGVVKQGTHVLSVSVDDQPHAIEDLARLPVVASGHRTFLLGDVTAIHPEESHDVFYRLNGETAVSLSLFRQPAADAIKTAARIRAAIAELRPQLPLGVQMKISSDESTDLDAELRDLITRGAIAFVAVFLVLLITLRSLSGGSLVIASAGVAIAGAALSLYLLHIPANTLTLAGLGMGIGILVQNGLVVVERLRSAKNTAESRAETGKRIAPAVLGSTLTTTVVLLPFLYLQGNARAQFAPFAAAFALALFWSVATALVFVPAVGRGSDGRTKGWPRLARLYGTMVGATLRWRVTSIALTVVALGVLTWGFIKKVPKVDWGRGYGDERTTVTASVSFPRGSDPTHVEDIISQLEADAVGQPGVGLVRSQGSGLEGEITVEFTKAGSESDAPWAISDKLTERAVLVGGTDHVSVSRPQGNGYYNGSGGGGSYSAPIYIYGYSYEGVLQMALDLQDRLKGIPRVRDISINAGQYGNQDQSVSVSLTPDRVALARIGASAAEYASSVRAQISTSASSTTLQAGRDEIPITLRAAGARERDIRELAEGPVFNDIGAPTRIGDVSTVGEVLGLAAIRRDNQRYVRVLSYDFRGPQKLADRTHKSFMKSITTPPGYTVTDERDPYVSDDSAKGLNLVFGIGIVLVLLAVALVFNSVWAAAMVLLALPMALGGVVAAFWITKAPFVREAAVGVILVVGLAVNHSILLIDAALEARRRNGNRLSMADALHAATDRVTMIVLVTLTTLASLTPMAIGTKSSSLFGAIALATAGGTLAGTLGVMFILPPMLLGVRRKGGRRKEKGQGREKGEGRTAVAAAAEA
jgi:HAE1 family hydrophobic/amphiphilic exporter-1